MPERKKRMYSKKPGTDSSRRRAQLAWRGYFVPFAAAGSLVSRTSVLVERLHASVVAIVDVDLVLDRVDRDSVDAVEVTRTRFRLLRGPLPLLAPRHHVLVVLVVLHDARVRIAVGDEVRAIRIPRDVGRAVEVRGIRCEHDAYTLRLHQL